jgi:AAA ATPase domain
LVPVSLPERVTLRVKELPGVASPVELKELSWCTVVCGPNNGGKTRLVRAMIVGKNLENGRTVSSDALRQISESFEANSFTGQRFTNHLIPRNGLIAAKEIFERRKHWYASDINEFVRLCTAKYHERYGQLGNQDATLMFASVFRTLFANDVPLTTAYLTPKRRLTSPGNLAEPNRQVEIDSAAIIGQLFALKNAPPDDKLNARYHEVRKLFKKVTDTDFDVSLQTGSGANIFLRLKTPRSKGYRDSNEVGLGYQDALTICYCLTETEVDILIVEEAENHLHPDIQRNLLREFISGEHKKRVIVSTHSPVFLERPEKTKIFVCRADRTPPVLDTTNTAVALASIGVTNLTPLTSGQILLVEGSSDVGAYRVLLDRLEISHRERIALVPLSGDNMIHFPLDVFKEVGNLQAIVDCDHKSKKNRDIFMQKCAELDIPVHRLERYAIDNYFDAAAYREVFPDKASSIPAIITPKTKIEQQLGFDPKSQLSLVAEAVDLLQIESSDLGKALRTFFPPPNEC